LNDTEIEISHLEFDDNDKEEDLKIKYDVLWDYNLRIKEREERKNFVFEKGLLDLRRENRIESKLNRDQFELLLFFEAFCEIL
jgi:transcriptional adapter 2-alpha